MNKYKVDIMICTKDRPTEIALLLQSLRTQTFQNFDIYIYDDRSGIPITAHSFVQKIVTQMLLENHKVEILRNEINYGVTRLRRILINKILSEGNGDLILRLDDDNILNPDYIERLINVIELGYDIASGIVPAFGQPTIKRRTENVKPFISDIKLDTNGNIINFGDDCGIEYYDKEIIPSPHFRSMCLGKKEIFKQVQYEDNLGNCSFREEEFFSFKAIIKGFTFAVDTGAIAWHLLTPSGGERTQEYVNNLQFNHFKLNELSKELYKKYGDFIETYRNKVKTKFNIK
jgi:glycosyltransferase involved in cell wall biosynthesis